MGIWQRFMNILRGNANALLDQAEDPAVQIELTLNDLRNDMATVKMETATVMADEKTAKRKLDECKEKIEEHAVAAKKALSAGNENDARHLLEKKKALEAALPDLQANYDLCKANAEKMQQMYNKLSADIERLEARKDAIQSKVAAARAQKRINKVIAGTSTSDASIATFERMEEKADKILDTAMAEADLNAASEETRDLVEKYNCDDTSVDDELAAMKAELGL